MAHRGKNTGGSQFFICHNRQNTQHLDGVHTCFGKVIDGLDVIDDIRPGDLILPKKAREELDVLLWLIILNFEFLILHFYSYDPDFSIDTSLGVRKRQAPRLRRCLVRPAK